MMEFFVTIVHTALNCAFDLKRGTREKERTNERKKERKKKEKKKWDEKEIKRKK